MEYFTVAKHHSIPAQNFFIKQDHQIATILLLCGSFNIDFPARGLGALHFSDSNLKK
jgi:hypothetical protein